MRQCRPNGRSTFRVRLAITCPCNAHDVCLSFLNRHHTPRLIGRRAYERATQADEVSGRRRFGVRWCTGWLAWGRTRGGDRACRGLYRCVGPEPVAGRWARAKLRERLICLKAHMLPSLHSLLNDLTDEQPTFLPSRAQARAPARHWCHPVHRQYSPPLIWPLSLTEPPTAYRHNGT